MKIKHLREKRFIRATNPRQITLNFFDGEILMLPRFFKKEVAKQMGRAATTLSSDFVIMGDNF
jgi:hypothetical protein